MRKVCTINLAVVSRRDLYYVSENESFCFGHKLDFQVPGQAWTSGVGVRCRLLKEDLGQTQAALSEDLTPHLAG